MQPNKMSVEFDLIRLGTKHENNNTLKPVHGVSNGTIIAFGDNLHNTDFIGFGNELVSFFIKRSKVKILYWEKI